jgi:hypothetical protein
MTKVHAFLAIFAGAVLTHGVCVAEPLLLPAPAEASEAATIAVAPHDIAVLDTSVSSIPQGRGATADAMIARTTSIDAPQPVLRKKTARVFFKARKHHASRLVRHASPSPRFVARPVREAALGNIASIQRSSRACDTLMCSGFVLIGVGF